MTKETIALHGTKKLLQQARKDLVAAGFKDDKRWNDGYETWLEIYYLSLSETDGIGFYNHDCDASTIIDLTTENYEHVINLIITKKYELCN